MSLRVLARHPSPVSVIPRRGRAARHGWETIATPVTVPDAGPDEFRPLDMGDAPGAMAGFPVLVRGGATWSVLADRVPGGLREIRPAELAALLRGEPQADPGAADAIVSALRGTPLVAIGIGPAQHYALRARVPAEDPRWLAPSPGDRVEAEERERSAARVVAWAEADLAVAGDRVMMRRPAYVATMLHARRKDFVLDTDFHPRPFEVIPARPDRARAVAEAIPDPYETGAEQCLAAIEAAMAGLSTDDDIVRLANHLPLLVEASARAEEGRAAWARAVWQPDLARRTLDALRPWALRGAVAGVTREEAAEVLALCASAIPDLLEAGLPMGPHWAGFMAQVEAEHMPRAARVDPEDVDAIGRALDPGTR